MIFEDRREAGKLLTQKLMTYKANPDAIVIGLPRGGVVVAYEIAIQLKLPLDIVCPRKIGAPFNPELAIGAITETGAGDFDERLVAMLEVQQSYIEQMVEEEKNKAKQRLLMFRKGLPRRLLEDKIVILVDDGLATGATMKLPLNR